MLLQQAIGGKPSASSCDVGSCLLRLFHIKSHKCVDRELGSRDTFVWAGHRVRVIDVEKELGTRHLVE